MTVKIGRSSSGCSSRIPRRIEFPVGSAAGREEPVIDSFRDRAADVERDQ